MGIARPATDFCAPLAFSAPRAPADDGHPRADVFPRDPVMAWNVLVWTLPLIVLMLFACNAFAHDSWINQQRLTDPASGQWCCNHKDCDPVPKDGLTERGGGYFVTETGETIPYSRVIWKSPDGAWWRCRWFIDGKQATRCLIGPPTSY